MNIAALSALCLVTEDIFITVYNELSDFVNAVISKEGPLPQKRYAEVLKEFAGKNPGYETILNHYNLRVGEDGSATVIRTKERDGFLNEMLSLPLEGGAS